MVGHVGYIGWGDCKDPAYRALIAARNPYAWWVADDTGGNLVDHADSHNASPSGGGTGITYRVPGPQGSPCSYAVDLAGEFFNTGISPIGDTQHYAVLVNIRPDAYNGDSAIFATWNDGEGFMMYMPDTAGQLRQYHGGTFYDTGFTPTIGAWSNVLFGWNGSTVKSWGNGSSLVSSGNGSGAGALSSTAPFIGTYNNRGISTWNGALSHIALFLDAAADAILTDSEALLLAEAALAT